MRVPSPLHPDPGSAWGPDAAGALSAHAPAAGSEPPSCSLPGTWALCLGARLWPLPVCAVPPAPPVSPATPGVTRGWPRALFTRLCLLGQSTARLDSDRTPSASSTAERGMVKPMVRVEQQLDYRRQDSRWGRALGA